MKPSFSARASSSFQAVSTLGWFCGAKIAVEIHSECGSTVSHWIVLRTSYDRPSPSRMRFHSRELPPLPSRWLAIISAG